MPLVLIRVTEGLGKSVVDVIELEKKKEQPKAEVKEHTVKEPALKPGGKCQVKEDSEHRLAVRLVSLAHHESIYERNIALINVEDMIQRLVGSMPCMRPGASKNNPAYDFDPKLLAAKNIIWMALETSRRRMKPSQRRDFRLDRTGRDTEGVGRTLDIITSGVYERAETAGLARKQYVFHLEENKLMPMWEFCDKWIDDHHDEWHLLCNMLGMVCPAASDKDLNEILLGD